MGDAAPAASYSWFDHTADIGLEVTAPTLEALFETAATALFDLLVETPAAGGASGGEKREIRAAAGSGAELLVRWLSELLYLHDAEGLVLRGFEIVELREDRVTGRAVSERYDPVRHRPRTQIKAVTYHQLLLQRQEGEGWKARLVFDV
ncbi:MAG TPA: archease [Candidatus Polarisedimenticolia bacterium]|jgi:SHS2 domain-containing protein